MRIAELEGGFAWCEGRGRRCRVDLALVGAQPPGTWLLVFIDSAREVIDNQRAAQVDAALDALEAAMRGESFEHFIADLVEREPQLPEFLRNAKGGEA